MTAWRKKEGLFFDENGLFTGKHSYCYDDGGRLFRQLITGTKDDAEHEIQYVYLPGGSPSLIKTEQYTNGILKKYTEYEFEGPQITAHGGSSGGGGGTNVKRATDVTKVETYLAQFKDAAPAGESAQAGSGSASSGGQAGVAEAEPPVLALNVQLTAENWMAILNSLENAAVQVRLDLSDCKPGTLATGGGLRSDGVFDTNVATEFGRKYIAEIILPKAATAIVGVVNKRTAFYNFTNLKAASGENITSIGNEAFSNRTKLETAHFPKAEEIGNFAFSKSKLINADFPAATSIGGAAFQECRSLASINFPAVTSIGNNAFGECRALTSASFPAATSIGPHAFNGCSALVNVRFPVATSIRGETFKDCRALTAEGIDIRPNPAARVFYDIDDQNRSVCFDIQGFTDSSQEKHTPYC